MQPSTPNPFDEWCLAGASVPDDAQTLLANFVDPVEMIPLRHGAVCDFRKNHEGQHIGKLAPSRDDAPSTFWLVWGSGAVNMQVILHCTRDDTCSQPAGHAGKCGSPFQ